MANKKYNAKNDGALKNLISQTVSHCFCGHCRCPPCCSVAIADNRDQEKGQCVRKYNKHEVNQKAGNSPSAKAYQSIADAAVAAVALQFVCWCCAERAVSKIISEGGLIINRR